MPDYIILSLIGFLILCLIVTVVVAIVYSGLLTEVNIKTGSPPIRNVTIVYKLHKGTSKDCGAAFTEAVSIGPKLKTIRVSYNDLTETPEDQCHYIVGSILSEGEEKPDEELRKLYETFGFKLMSLPEVPLAVTTTFPSTTPLSHWLAPYRVYPELRSYITERQLHAWPYIEINTGQLTHYMAPLSSQSDHRHTGFIVPELITPTAAKTPVTEESSDLTGEMDTSGAEPQSDVITKPSVQAQSEDTEMSQAQPSACFTSTLLPHRDQGDGNDQEQAEEHTEPSNKEHGDRGSSESVDSGSSFEELELVEEQERELGTGGSEDEGHSQWGGGAKDDPGEYLAGEREQKCDSEE
ncbi:testis-expressed protein 264 [Esox lucius]|uniref:Testis expressed 264, ER-phagy receptor a n=1 Tax=Esox lucius TaxID=8010 RepID=A0A3P9AAB3_ESOLU|nr:testis-expressed protein 264 [Esox lucius]